MNKKIAETLNEKGILNDYGIVENGHPWIYLYIPGQRDMLPSAWVLTVKGMEFKKAAWYEHGSRHYSYMGVQRRKERLTEVLEWVEVNFPDIKMVKSPFSRFDLIPEADLKKALEGKLEGKDRRLG